jgi:hypothetical protein
MMSDLYPRPNTFCITQIMVSTIKVKSETLDKLRCLKANLLLDRSETWTTDQLLCELIDLALTKEEILNEVKKR